MVTARRRTATSSHSSPGGPAPAAAASSSARPRSPLSRAARPRRRPIRGSAAAPMSCSERASAVNSPRPRSSRARVRDQELGGVEVAGEARAPEGLDVVAAGVVPRRRPTVELAQVVGLPPPQPGERVRPQQLVHAVVLAMAIGGGHHRRARREPVQDVAGVVVAGEGDGEIEVQRGGHRRGGEDRVLALAEVGQDLADEVVGHGAVVAGELPDEGGRVVATVQGQARETNAATQPLVRATRVAVWSSARSSPSRRNSSAAWGSVNPAGRPAPARTGRRAAAGRSPRAGRTGSQHDGEHREGMAQELLEAGRAPGRRSSGGRRAPADRWVRPSRASRMSETVLARAESSVHEGATRCNGLSSATAGQAVSAASTEAHHRRSSRSPGSSPTHAAATSGSARTQSVTATVLPYPAGALTRTTRPRSRGRLWASSAARTDGRSTKPGGRSGTVIFARRMPPPATGLVQSSMLVLARRGVAWIPAGRLIRSDSVGCHVCSHSIPPTW